MIVDGHGMMGSTLGVASVEIGRWANESMVYAMHHRKEQKMAVEGVLPNVLGKTLVEVLCMSGCGIIGEGKEVRLLLLRRDVWEKVKV
ncbi:MAG: hypothetical protein ACOC7K_02720 [bacterium]